MLSRILFAATFIFALNTASCAEIVIGVAGPMTGLSATYGFQMRQGAELAVEDINRRGGLLGHKLRLVVKDDGGDSLLAKSVAEALVAERARLVVGHFHSGASIAAAPIYAAGGVAMITPASSHPAVTEQGLWNVARTCGRYDLQGAFVGAIMAKDLRRRRVAVVTSRNPDLNVIASRAIAKLRRSGLKPTVLRINDGDTKFSGLIRRLRNRGTEAVFLSVYDEEAGLFLRQGGNRFRTYLSDMAYTDEFSSITAKVTNGVRTSALRDYRSYAAAKNVVRRFRATGFEPEGYTLYAYGAVQVYAAAATAAGSRDAKRVMRRLRSGRTFGSVVGRLRFDERGNVLSQQYGMYVWRNGKIVPQ